MVKQDYLREPGSRSQLNQSVFVDGGFETVLPITGTLKHISHSTPSLSLLLEFYIQKSYIGESLGRAVDSISKVNQRALGMSINISHKSDLRGTFSQIFLIDTHSIQEEQPTSIRESHSS